MYGVSSPDDRVEQLLTTFDLQGKRSARAADLSRGMRQKLAICCAYLHEPRAILLDEPMTGLDPRGIRVLKESIIDRARDGAAVIISSHLLAMVEDICTHVLVLHLGQQQFCGTIEEFRATFASAEANETLEDGFFKAIEGADSDADAVHPVAAAH